MKHVCHARDCDIAVAPELLMCRKHWFMVPKVIQRAVWRHYQEGQCAGKMLPSDLWHNAADAAIGYVANREGKKITHQQREAVNGIYGRQVV